MKYYIHENGKEFRLSAIENINGTYIAKIFWTESKTFESFKLILIEPYLK